VLWIVTFGTDPDPGIRTTDLRIRIRVRKAQQHVYGSGSIILVQTYEFYLKQLPIVVADSIKSVDLDPDQ
jgi:hypothetical protein